jgi:hypothetical protein
MMVPQRVVTPLIELRNPMFAKNYELGLHRTLATRSRLLLDKDMQFQRFANIIALEKGGDTMLSGCGSD